MGEKKLKLVRSIWTNDCEASILFRGEPYFVKFDIVYDDHAIPSRCDLLEFCPTKQPLDEDRGSYVQWGGYPHFKQDTAIPYSDDGIPYDFLCMVDNGWGDSGTCNIFILVRKGELGYEVEDLYMEYSCC
jgi:hypothetical protein